MTLGNLLNLGLFSQTWTEDNDIYFTTVLWNSVKNAYKMRGTLWDIHWMLGHHQKEETGKYFSISADFKDLYCWSYRFFFLCPFSSFGRGQLSWALKHLEGHSVHEFVLAFISAFYILFYPLPRGHFDWHGSQVKQSTPSEGHTLSSSMRTTSFLSYKGWLSSSSLCFWEIFDVFLALSVLFLACLIHQHHKTLSAQTQKQDANIAESI